MLVRKPWGQSWPLQVQKPSPCLDDSQLRYSSAITNRTTVDQHLLHKKVRRCECMPAVCAHSEWAVGDVNSAPRDHGCVFYRFPWCVGATVCAVPVIFNLDIHRKAFAILHTRGQVKIWRCVWPHHLKTLVLTGTDRKQKCVYSAAPQNDSHIDSFTIFTRHSCRVKFHPSQGARENQCATSREQFGVQHLTQEYFGM